MILYSRYHNNTMINFLPGIKVTTGQVGSGEERKDELWIAPPNTTVSTLVIQQTLQIHAGNYTCAPPHATSDTVRLYVAQGKIILLGKPPKKSTFERTSQLIVVRSPKSKLKFL